MTAGDGMTKTTAGVPSRTEAVDQEPCFARTYVYDLLP